MLKDFSRRWTTQELMEGADVSFDVFCRWLADLERVNRLTLAYRPTLAFLDQLVTRRPCTDAPLSILDVGFGRGDMLRRIAQWASDRGIPVTLVGVDLHPWSATAAALIAKSSNVSIEWRTGSVFEFDPGRRFDAVISSLFAHHLPDGKLARFLEWMEQRAALGWFVNDLHRQAAPYYAFALGARILRMDPFIQADGPISIGRSFRRDDWRRLLELSSIPAETTRIEAVFPYRICVTRTMRGRAAKTINDEPA